MGDDSSNKHSNETEIKDSKWENSLQKANRAANWFCLMSFLLFMHWFTAKLVVYVIIMGKII